MSYYECEHGRDIGRCQECADEKDSRAEITRLRAELERVRGQRDALAHRLAAEVRSAFYIANDPNELADTDYRAKTRAINVLGEYSLRIVNGTVEEME